MQLRSTSVALKGRCQGHSNFESFYRTVAEGGHVLLLNVNIKPYMGRPMTHSLGIPSIGRMPYVSGRVFFSAFFFLFFFLPPPPSYHQIWSGSGKHPCMTFIFGIGLP